MHVIALRCELLNPEVDVKCSHSQVSWCSFVMQEKISGRGWGGDVLMGDYQSVESGYEGHFFLHVYP